jgi:hypothetical protein
MMKEAGELHGSKKCACALLFVLSILRSIIFYPPGEASPLGINFCSTNMEHDKLKISSLKSA